MITILTSALPILLGFFAKLLAIKSQASSDNQRMLLEALSAKNAVIDSAREAASKEGPAAAWNRRVIIFSLLGLVVFLQVAPALFDIDTVIPTVREGISFLGFQLTPDKIEYVTVQGMVKFTEIFEWVTLIVEMYFGAQLAKGK